MFGISGAEFLVIILIATAVIPAKNWPVVFKALAKLINFIRHMAWKITDASEQVKDRIERELPIDKLSQETMDDVMHAFREPIKSVGKSISPVSKKKNVGVKKLKKTMPTKKIIKKK